jgi:hypothetical protein
MISLLMESVVIAFALGGVVGAVISIHLLYRNKEMPAYSGRGDSIPDGQSLMPSELDAKLKFPPRR